MNPEWGLTPSFLASLGGEAHSIEPYDVKFVEVKP